VISTVYQITIPLIAQKQRRTTLGPIAVDLLKALSPSFYYHEFKDCFKILRAEQEKSDGNREEFSVSCD
jgi:hypothetical protein